MNTSLTVKHTTQVLKEEIAHLYITDGFPLYASALECRKKGVLISWLNVVQAMTRHGYKKDKIISECRAVNDFCPDEINIEEITTFLNIDYEAQREMLWDCWCDKIEFI